MKRLKGVFFLLIILLLLEVAKALLTKRPFEGSYFLSMVIMCLQFFLLLGSILYVIMNKLVFRKFPSRRNRIFSLISVLGIFILLELLFGYWLNNPQHIPRMLQWSYYYYYDYYDTRLIQYEKGKAVYDSALFYRLNPNHHFRYRNREFDTDFHINSKGLRDNESSLTAPEVIVLGDSYVMGWGVEEPETISKQLEKVSGLRVLNAGISSYGTARELKLLNQLDVSQLKFVIIPYCMNDIIENRASKKNQYHLPVSSNNAFDSLQASHGFVRRYFPGKYFLTIGQSFVKHEINKIYPLFKLRLDRLTPFRNEKEHAVEFLDVLSNTDVKWGNAKIIVTMMGTYPDLKSNFLKDVQTISQQEPYKSRFDGRLFTVPIEAGLGPGDFFFLDLHIRPSGHKKMADNLWEEIRKY